MEREDNKRTFYRLALVALLLMTVTSGTVAAPPKLATIHDQWKSLEGKRGILKAADGRPYFTPAAEGLVVVRHVGADYLVFAVRSTKDDRVWNKITPMVTTDIHLPD